MNMESVLTQAASWAIGFLAIALFLSFLRLRLGPTLADRVLALDLMTTILMGIFGCFAIYSRQKVYVDVTLVLALIAFLSTVVYARLMEKDGALKAGKGEPN